MSDKIDLLAARIRECEANIAAKEAQIRTLAMLRLPYETVFREIATLDTILGRLRETLRVAMRFTDAEPATTGKILPFAVH